MPRILLADDDPLIRATLGMVLREQGHEVSQAANGREAMRVLQQTGIDLVLTDILMPEMDGLELVRAIRHSFSSVRVVAMSGGSSHMPGTDALQMARLLGAHAVLPKPFTAEEVAEALGAALA